MPTAVLHMLCGKIASGKSTLASELARAPSTLIISEDYWLARLFKPEMGAVSDYIRFSRRLCAAMGPHVQDLLRLGVSVVLDFPANTPDMRGWMKTLYEGAGADHLLYVLDAPDAICKERLRARNALGAHDFSASDEEFDLITRYFVPPTPDEDFKIVRRLTAPS